MRWQVRTEGKPTKNKHSVFVQEYNEEREQKYKSEFTVSEIK